MGKRQQESKEVGKRSKANTSVAKELLNSYRDALMSAKEFFDRASKDMSNIDDIELQLKIALGIVNLGEKLGKNIESLDKLEDKVEREERESVNRKGGTETALFED